MTDPSQAEIGVTHRRSLIAGFSSVGAGGVTGCLHGGESADGTTPPQRTTQPATTEPVTAAQHPSNGGETSCAVQSAVDGHVVPLGRGLGVTAAIDPTTTRTPVQDAVDMLHDADRAGGTVLLPPQTVTEAEPITGLTRTILQGFAMGTSAIRFPPETHGIVAEGSHTAYAELRDLALYGPKNSDNTGSAILFDVPNNTYHFNMDNVQIVGWNDKVVHMKDGSTPYECHWGKVHMWGNRGTLLQIEDLGPGNTWENAKLNTQKGRIIDINNTTGGFWDIGVINSGGDYSGVSYPINLAGLFGNGGINIEYLNFEPSGGKGEKAHVRLKGGNVDIGHIVSSGTVDHVVESVKGGNWRVGTISTRNAVNRAPIGITGEDRGPMRYGGLSEHVENRTGAELTYGVACIGDLSLVK